MIRCDDAVRRIESGFTVPDPILDGHLAGCVACTEYLEVELLLRGVGTELHDVPHRRASRRVCWLRGRSNV